MKLIALESVRFPDTIDDRRLAVVIGARESIATATRQRPDDERQGQKKNENPAFHSLTSSLSLRLVKTTCVLYSPRNTKRRVK